MAVKVDVCGPGMPCLAGRCSERARFFVQRDDMPRLHYCGPDTLRRIWFYQRQNRAINVTDAARPLLDEVAV